MDGPGAQQPRGYDEAILRPTRARDAIRVERVATSDDLATWIDYHWYVGWSLEGTHDQQVVPQPRVHLAAAEGRVMVHGVSRDRFHRQLSGTGHVLGSALHPGAFRSFLPRVSPGGVAVLTDQFRPAADVLGPDDRPTARAILAASDVGDTVPVMEDYLRALRPRHDPVLEEVRALVDLAEADRSVVRADELARRGSRSLRSLQRLFSEYVGVGPKWVISRFRILDAAATAHTGERVDWAKLADELGFTDQAHLTRAFTAVVGTPPATYAREA